ncbi:hypothetical protein ANN_01173 [Periplaneta americana]|uniref:Uncharacterized protein n=1 Tax=Periplaneta americana TaxID=6978 RepID=A0ABQ8TSU4_PERAM|nr:hypothetical protein ANN_01173 [Periplaneta americana]
MISLLLFKDEQHRWIGRGGPVQWPPRSPDLTPMLFFRFVYSTPIDTAELVVRIAAAAMVIAETPGGSTIGDYHREMNSIFEKWLRERVTPNFPPASVTVRVYYGRNRVDMTEVVVMMAVVVVE